MKDRLTQLVGVMGTVAVVTVAMATVAGQTPRPQAQSSGAAIKTSWGEPDLQGIWAGEFQVPLQRPARFADKEVFTAEEVAELDKERIAKPTFGEKRAERGTEKDVAGAYDSTVFLTKRPTGKQTSMIFDPPDGRMPPVTPAVQKRRAEIRDFQLALLEATETCRTKSRGCEGGKYTGVANPRRLQPPPHYMANIRMNRNDGPEDRSLGERCMQAIIPDFFVGGTGGIAGFFQSPGTVSIFYDTGQGQGWHRVIPVDNSKHLPPSVRLWWGDSRGRWEGNTLVVDVTNFSPYTDFQGSRENLHLIERWTRTGPNTLEYVVTVDDPTTWTKPWSARREMTLQSPEHNRIYKEPRCHEGNYGMIAMLAGVRSQELAFAEGRGPDPATTNVDTPTNAALDDEDLDDLN
jgi:hypothetical protein